MTPSGRFHRLVACDEPVRNDAGEITGFVEAFTAKANIEPLRGREQATGNQLLANADTVIRMLWSPRNTRIDATWRLRYKETIYDIAAPMNVKTAHRELEIIARSGTNAG